MRREIVKLTLIAILLVLIGTAPGGHSEILAQTQPASGPGRGLKIAYNVLVGSKPGDYEIFVMNVDGTEQKNISNSKGVDWVYYASGDKLYFVSDRDSAPRKYFLYEMNVDGQNVRKISQFVVEDSWLSSRKKGAEFVVSSGKDGKRHELYIIDKNGLELRRLTNDDIYDNDPAFSPDGKQVVFRSKRSGADELWIMDENGANLRQLTHYPKDEKNPDQNFYHASAPFWEPKRNLISFASKRNGNYSIFTIKPDGSGLKQITTGSLDEMWHAWSPDGKWIVYDGTDDQGNYDIYLMRSDGAELKRLTTEKRTEMAPVFVRATKP
jgi:TolB protein